MFRVVKTDGRIPVAPEQLAQFSGLDVDFIDRPCPTEDALIDTCAGASALIVVQEPVSARVIASLHKCKVISRMGVGLDTVDVDAATAAGIVVANVPDGNLDEVSTHAVAMILALVRRLPQFDALIRKGEWKALADGNRIGASIRRTSVLSLGLIGFGRIGALTARKAAALGFRVSVCDPYVADAVLAGVGAVHSDLDTLLAESDIVSLHVPLTKETRGMIDRRAIAAMKPGAILINTARGGMIDEAALADALHSGHIGGAGLDTFEREPIPLDHPLLSCPNLLLSPHGASYSVQSMAEIRTKAFANAAAVLRGERAPYQVNLI